MSLFDVEKMADLRSRLEEELRLATAEIERLEAAEDATTQLKTVARNRFVSAQEALQSFGKLCALRNLLDAKEEPLPWDVQEEPPAQGVPIGFYRSIAAFAAQTLAGKPREVYLLAGDGAAGALHDDYSFVYIWSGGNGSTIGIRQTVRTPGLCMVAVAQEPDWLSPREAQNKVAAELVALTSPMYQFWMRGLPVRLPPALPIGFSDWVQWTSRNIDVFLRMRDLMQDGFLKLGSEEWTTATLRAIGELMLPGWWEANPYSRVPKKSD